MVDTLSLCLNWWIFTRWRAQLYEVLGSQISTGFRNLAAPGLCGPRNEASCVLLECSVPEAPVFLTLSNASCVQAEFGVNRARGQGGQHPDNTWMHACLSSPLGTVAVRRAECWPEAMSRRDKQCRPLVSARSFHHASATVITVSVGLDGAQIPSDMSVSLVCASRLSVNQILTLRLLRQSSTGVTTALITALAGDPEGDGSMSTEHCERA